MTEATVVVPTLQAGERLRGLLESLAVQTQRCQIIVVDNASEPGAHRVAAGFDDVEVVRLERNAGFSQAVNIGAERVDCEVLVLLNDDCRCDPEFTSEVAAALDPGSGTVMAAAVLRDRHDHTLIDSAGMELDSTLLVFDYLNGEPVSALEQGVPDPVGPSAAAAAFAVEAFREVGGFDERLFAYWEDVDLVLRLRSQGGRCALASGARGVHHHSATLGSGSRRKNYLMGFGRGYVLRKWGVLGLRRFGAIVARDGVICMGQALMDRNLSGVRGRLHGFRAAEPTEPYPLGAGSRNAGTGAVGTLRRRAKRRMRLRRRALAR